MAAAAQNLRHAKGLDPMIEAAKSGLPIDITKVPNLCIKTNERQDNIVALCMWHSMFVFVTGVTECVRCTKNNCACVCTHDLLYFLYVVGIFPTGLISFGLVSPFVFSNSQVPL